jgi:5-methylcytosine-specific restriction protein B
MSRYKNWLAYVLNLIGESRPLEEARDSRDREYVAKAIERPYGIDDLLAEGVFLEAGAIEGALASLEDRRNLILSGPPGTGKSWLALRLAWIKLGNRGEDPRLMAVQFHQSYSYEEFVRGWRPGKDGFELRDGPFLEFCEAARNDGGRPYLLSIDEINRGDPSRIFGEMLSLLEKDKRRPECAVRLSLQKPDEPPFYVPPNLYLIGTMNSADRSLAVVDYALRRRFAFVQLEPAFGKDAFSNYMGDDLGVGMDPELLKRIVESMSRLNEEIAKDRNLGPGYRIGHSFFSSIDDETKLDGGWFESIVESQVIPTLEEYWFDQPDKVKRWRDELIR